MSRATNIDYLLRIYASNVDDLIGKYGGYEAYDRYMILWDQPNEDNIEVLIDGFFFEIGYAWNFLYSLRNLNPELSEYEKPLYFIYRLIDYTIIGWAGKPSVQSVLENLLAQSRSTPHPHNYSIPVTAFIELNQTSFQKIDDLGREVAESFTSKGVNATRLDNTVNMVEELESILGQWIYKYS